MATITINPGDIRELNAEIARIDARLRSLDGNLEFFTNQLNGKPEELLYTQDQIDANPALASEQRVVTPEIVGATQRDAAFSRLIIDDIQTPIIDPYENERKALDGKFADFTIPGPSGPGSGLFDENLIQVSGGERILPLFDVNVNAIEPLNPGEMFGGTGSGATPNEVADLSTEGTLIASLLSGT